MPGLLESLAEASVTLAGFAAVFRAFASGDDPDGFSAIRLTTVIEGSLVLAFLCYLPAALAAAGLESNVAWRVSNAVAVAWMLPRQIWVGVGISRRGRPLPSLFPLAFGLALVAFAAFLAGVVGLLPAESAHQAGAVFQPSNVGTSFLAQFRVERGGR